MSKLSTTTTSKHATSASRSDAGSASFSADSSACSSVTSHTLSATKPPLPAESLRKLYKGMSVLSGNSDDESTASNATTATSNLSGRRSPPNDTSNEARQARSERKSKHHSSRIAHLEQTTARYSELDSKVDSVNATVNVRLTEFTSQMNTTVQTHLASSQETMLAMQTRIDQLTSMVEQLLPGSKPPTPVTTLRPSQYGSMVPGFELIPYDGDRAPGSKLTFSQRPTSTIELNTRSPNKKKLRSATQSCGSNTAGTPASNASEVDQCQSEITATDFESQYSGKSSTTTDQESRQNTGTHSQSSAAKS